MSSSRKRRLDLSERACLECQRRKTRCIPSGDDQPCEYCNKTGKRCHFAEPPARTPLTRKNLDALESRCQHLESIIEGLQSSNALPVSNADVATHGASADPKHAVGTTYEWNENQGPKAWSATPPEEEQRDGMVMNGAAHRTSGFLGDTAGSNILKSVTAMLPPSSPPPQQRNTLRKWPIQTLSSSTKLPIMSGSLNSQSLQNHLLDIYFTTYNVTYPVLHELAFREQCSSRSQLPANSTWHSIYYMVLAIAEWSAGYADDHQSVFYEAARSRLRIDILETGTMAVVQLLLLMGNYLQKRDRPNTGYNYVGIAYRVALGLGLHRETSSSHQGTTFVQHRRRLLFWTLYCFESGFSLTTGRPTLVSDSFIDARKPQNIDDSRAAQTMPLAHEVDYPTSCTSIVAQARLAVIANRVHSDFLSVPACPNVDHQIAVMEQAIQNWRQTLPQVFWISEVPEWFLPPRHLLLWREANLRILLLLAGQRHQKDESEKMAIGMRCHKVAAGAIHDIVDFCEAKPTLMHLGLSWYAVYYLSQAVLALGVHQLKARRQSRSQTALSHTTDSGDWQTALARADSCLETLGRTNKAALRTLRILHKIRQNMQPESDSQASSNRTTVVANASPGRTGQEALLNGQRDTNQFAKTSQGYAADTATTTLLAQPSDASFLNTSPADIIATRFVENDWVAAADPSLHLFLDNVDSIEEIFQDVHGFPSTLEQENFSYMTSSMQTMRGDVLGDSWLDFVDPSIEDST